MRLLIAVSLVMLAIAVVACGRSVSQPAGVAADASSTEAPTEPTATVIRRVQPAVTSTVAPAPTPVVTPTPERPFTPVPPAVSGAGMPPRTYWRLLDQRSSSDGFSIYVLAVAVVGDRTNVVYSIENSRDLTVSRIGSLNVVDQQYESIENTTSAVLKMAPGITIGTISFPTESVIPSSTLSLEVDSIWTQTETAESEIAGNWDVEFLQLVGAWLSDGNSKLVRGISADAAPVPNINVAHWSILAFDLNIDPASFPERIYLELTEEHGVTEISYERYTDVALGRVTAN